ncbi:MAG: hypothetical protein ACUVRV_06260 [Cyanobacteriota bacterium]
MSDLSFSEQERLKQIERELKQASAGQGSSAFQSHLPQNPVRSWAETWGRPLLTVLAILGCMLLVSWFFQIFGAVLKLAVVAGLGYLLYAFVVAPRLGLGAKSDRGDFDVNGF